MNQKHQLGCLLACGLLLVWAVAETCGFGGCLKMLEVFGE